MVSAQAVNPIPATGPSERFLAILGAGICLVVTFLLWRSIRVYQPMWPQPGLYFLEVVALALLAAVAFIPGEPGLKYIVWGAAGALFGFSILGSLSVGFFYLPVAVIFMVLSVTSDVRNKQSITAHLGVFLAAGLAQAALMLAVVHIIRR
jgi:hypothetical protein